MNLFIDTNVFLSFYHYTTDDLEELRKLAGLVKQKKINLFLPDQVRNEFHRNRDNKIADALKRLSDQKLNLQFPQFCKDYEEYKKLRLLQKEYSKIHGNLIERINEDIHAHNLKADSVINELFPLSTIIEIDDETINHARIRIEKGDPPGKGGSIGDALIWEALLKVIPEEEDIFFITDDKDYTSPVDKNVFNSFLLNEWNNIKHSSLHFYKSLSAFFNKHFEDISLANELKKDILILKLANSLNFADTHKAIAALNRIQDFTIAQINAVLEAAVTNNQIYWIIGDQDVREFIERLIRGKEDELERSHLEKLDELFDEADALSEDIPF